MPHLPYLPPAASVALLGLRQLCAPLSKARHVAGQARARPKRLKPRPSLAGAWGSLWHALALKEAPGEPAGRRLSYLVCDAGQQATHRPTSMHRVMAEDAKAD